MSINDFILELKKLNYKASRWMYNLTKMILLDLGHSNLYCPITLLAFAKTGKIFEVGDYVQAGKAIGLDEDSSKEIVLASDGKACYDQDLRSKLLEIFNIEKS